MDINYSGEVAAALSSGRPVVALESTVIAHGLPHPQNVETALRLESIVRENAAVPATIAVLDGSFCVGLEQAQIERLATGGDIRKLSIRDLAIAAANQLDGATTVATTTFIAHRAGIRVFATGGIGGVHRGDASDVSADLPELARTPITVVCSGAKIVLDLNATREWLETHGVPVLGWQTDQMPAFFSRDSGLAVDDRVDTAEQAAAIVFSRDALGLQTAVLVTVPVPDEFEIDRAEMEDIVASAVTSAADHGVAGKGLTPFLLKAMTERTAGRTLAANIALLENNARVASLIAAAMA